MNVICLLQTRTADTVHSYIVAIFHREEFAPFLPAISSGKKITCFFSDRNDCQYIFWTWDNKHSRDTLVSGALICWVGLKQ